MLVTQSVKHLGISVTAFVYLFYKEGGLGGSQSNLTFLVWVCFCGLFCDLFGRLGFFVCLFGGFGCCWLLFVCVFCLGFWGGGCGFGWLVGFYLFIATKLLAG